ncbi:MAG TPA: hypothetical protein PLE99_05515 [Candidatus Thiothrix moscowensis]|uniref:hypothetical protein n=1 Tax=unclassified Thiothrix TaxID=2636184 RepID=UPI0025F29C70|nr:MULTISPECIES: hypothetical protein [unclassified Thiothrix]HRJ52201.1 hypothetical protein [Candidatus Thiothrix moscowensis]HRJ92516.1 hypothetical protein [Candidatus Thiothrix moscowensis]
MTTKTQIFAGEYFAKSPAADKFCVMAYWEDDDVDVDVFELCGTFASADEAMTTVAKIVNDLFNFNATNATSGLVINYKVVNMTPWHHMVDEMVIVEDALGGTSLANYAFSWGNYDYLFPIGKCASNATFGDALGSQIPHVDDDDDWQELSRQWQLQQGDSVSRAIRPSGKGKSIPLKVKPRMSN